MMFSKISFGLLPLAMVVLLPWVSAGSFEYRVDPWGVPDSWSDGYPPLDAHPGDTISFYWTDTGYDANNDYNVYLYPTTSCSDETNKVWVGSSSGATYHVDEWDAGQSLHFTCDTDDYCERGMSIVINVSADPAPAPTQSWSTPWPTEWVAATPSPTKAPTDSPSARPIADPTSPPTQFPSASPIAQPTLPVTPAPTVVVTIAPTGAPNGNGAEDGKEILIENWDIPADTQPLPPIEANVGDTIVFVVNPGHDVFIHPTKSCDDTGAQFIGDATSGASYTFQPQDGSVEGTEHMFVCGVGSHCDLGMQLVVTVFAQPAAEEPQPEQEEEEGEENQQDASTAAPQNFNIDWDIPADTQPYDPIDVKVGDTITFNMSPGHNVTIHPSQSCDKDGAIDVGVDPTASYTFQPEDGSPDGNTMFFACDLGSHCDLGMQLVVNVFSQAPSGSETTTTNGSEESPPSVVDANGVSGREIIVDDWEVPADNQVFAPLEATVGDTIIFSWEGDQNVFIHPSKTCDDRLSIVVGLVSPAAYTFQPSDGSPEGREHLFVSNVDTNCELGMQLMVKVFSASDVATDGTATDASENAFSGATAPFTTSFVAYVLTMASLFFSSAFMM